MGKRRIGSPQRSKIMKILTWSISRKSSSSSLSSTASKGPSFERVRRYSQPASRRTSVDSGSSGQSSQDDTADRVMGLSTLPSPHGILMAARSPRQIEFARAYARSHARTGQYAGLFDESRANRAAFRQAHSEARIVYQHLARPGAVLPDCPHDWEIY